MDTTYRPAHTLDLQLLHTCEIKGHEIPLDLEDLRPMLNESETHIAVKGARVIAAVHLNVDEDGKKVELTRATAIPGEAHHLIELLKTVPRMGRSSDCTRITLSINEIDIEGGYGDFVRQFKFIGRTSGVLRAYGQSFDNYLYEAPFPLK